MTGLDLRYALWGFALVLLSLAPAIGGGSSAGWEFAQLSGWVGVLGCLALCGMPVRSREAVSPTLSLRHHALAGWAVLIAASLHVVGLVAKDRNVIEHLKPTAPPYEFAGVAALFLLAALVVSSPAAVRRRLWRNHRRFQATHVIAACLLVALIAAHVVVTNRYVTGMGRRCLFVLVAIGAILLLLLSRRQLDTREHLAGSLRGLVFGRHSRLVFTVVLICAMSIATLSVGRVTLELQQPVLARAKSLPLDFPHIKHTAVNCLICHHNYADRTGGDLCIGCHRSNRSDLEVGAEARFHGFCLGCHRHPDAGFIRHGPVSGCAVCHQVPLGAN
jgi:DMSO/TMAO reductase YedYZ heme-binding membrane subunit